MKVQRNIQIKTQPEKVWPLLVQPENVLKWCITFEKFQYTGGQLGAGAIIYVEEKIPGRLMKLNFLVTEWVENRRIALRMTSGEFAKAYEQKWVIEPTPTGSRFTFMENIEFPYGILGKTLGLFARSGSEATVKKMLVKLKSLAESQ
jgi:uncharacterized protein YndB with AHSA1/START domain